MELNWGHRGGGVFAKGYYGKGAEGRIERNGRRGSGWQNLSGAKKSQRV